MRVSFTLDCRGYPQARADQPCVVIGSMLGGDLQGDLSIPYALDRLRRARAEGSHVEITGNAQTIAVKGGSATVVCDDDPTMSASRVPLAPEATAAAS
jgi:hypothetical protein